MTTENETRARSRVPAHLKKVPFSTKLPLWLKEWLVADRRKLSAPVLIEQALCETHGLKAPKKGRTK